MREKLPVMEKFLVWVQGLQAAATRSSALGAEQGARRVSEIGVALSADHHAQQGNGGVPHGGVPHVQGDGQNEACDKSSTGGLPGDPRPDGAVSLHANLP